MTTTNDRGSEWSAERADKANAAKAFNEAFWTHVECCGNVATVKALASCLCACGCGSGTNAQHIKRIAQALNELADQMSA